MPLEQVWTSQNELNEATRIRMKKERIIMNDIDDMNKTSGK